MVKYPISWKKLSFLFLFTLICFSSLIGYLTVFLVNNPSPSNPNQHLNEPSPPLFPQTNLTPSGNGKSFDCYENAWGSKTHLNLAGTSSIAWETPGAWSGEVLSVSITGLKRVVSGTQDDVADSRFLFDGSYVSGNTYSTRYVDGDMLILTWVGLVENLNLSLYFNNFDPYYIVSQIDVYTYTYSNDSPPLQPRVYFYIHNYRTGTNDYQTITPEDSIDWANLTISENCSDYISSSGEALLFFHAGITGTQEGYFHIDSVRVEITYTHRWVRPGDVNFRLEGSAVQGFTYGQGSITLSGTWTGNPEYFQFSADFTLIFNATSSFTVFQDKIGSVTSTYFLNLSTPVPTHHRWELSFSQDPFLGNNFTNSNFSVSIIPSDWTLINATDPGGGLGTLDETPISGGMRLDADNDTYYDSGGTWTLFYTSPNYINNVELRKNLQLLPQNPNLLIEDTLDIRTIFQAPIMNGEVNLTVSFEATVNHEEDLTGISDAQVDFTPWDIKSTTNKNGTYIITTSFFNNTEIGIYSCMIAVDYPTNLTMFSPDLRYAEFLKGETLNITVFYNNTFYPGNFHNERGIPDSQVKWRISNSTGYSDSGDLTLQPSAGYYTTLLDTGTLDVWDGDYNITVTANRTTHENQSYTFEMRCFEIVHTTNATVMDLEWITGMNYTTGVFINQSLLIQMNFTDIYKGYNQLIDYADIAAHLYNGTGQPLSTYNTLGERYAPGYYRVNLTTIKLHVGQYSLLINCSKTYYQNSSVWINYTINELDPIIRVSRLSEINNITAYSEWENLTISFKVEYNATMYRYDQSWDSHIYWALVRYFIVPYGGDPLNPSDIVKSAVIDMNAGGMFELLDVPLENASGLIPPGDYEIYVACNATDCEERWYNFNLTVLKKINVTIAITRYPSEFVSNQLISISATLDSEDLETPIPFNTEIVYFNITVHYNSYGPVTFTLQDAANQFGQAQVDFYLDDYAPNIEDVDYVECFLYFEAREKYYPDYSFYGAISVTFTMDISAPFDFMFIIFIILGVVAGIGTLYVVHRKVIAPKQVAKTKSINYLFASFRDVVGIQNLFVLLKSTGSNLLQKTYAPGGIDYSMEKILVNVIANFGKGDQRPVASCDLIRFEDFMILVDDGDYIRVAVTIGSHPSDKLIRSLVRFVQFFELQNYSLLDSATGPVEGLQGVDDLLDLQFGSSLISPYTISRISKVSGFEETLALMATSLMAEHEYFYISQLYARAKNETLVDEMMIFSAIQNLMDKKVIIPFIEARKPTDIAKKLETTEFDRLKNNLISAKTKALKAVNRARFEEAVQCYHEAASLAAALGDVKAKNHFLAKAQECSAKIKLKKPVEEKFPEEEFKKPSPEEIPEPPPEKVPEIIPKRKSKPISRPTPKPPVEQIPKPVPKIEKPAPVEPPTSPPVEEIPPEETELTPFEKALALKDEEWTSATDLMAEEPTPTITPMSPPAVEEVVPEQETIEEEAGFIEELEVEPTEIKVKPTEEEEIEIESLLDELAPQPAVEEEISVEEIIDEVLPPSISANEVKALMKIFSESEKDLKSVPKHLGELSTIVKELLKQKESTTKQVKKTFTSVSNKLETITQHLFVPRKSTEEEVEIAQKEIPTIAKEIDLIDQNAVKIKKNITSAQKTSKKFRDKLEKTIAKISTIEKHLAKTTQKEMEQEKQQLISLKTSYNDATKNLDEIEKQISGLNTEIVTLMIEDIEQMMAQSLKTEKIVKDTTKKIKDSNNVQEALTKENYKLIDELENLKQIISLSETVSNEILSQKQSIVSDINNLETDFRKKIDSLLLSIKEHAKDSGEVITECQVMQNYLAKYLQSVENFKAKIEDALKDLKKKDKIVSKIAKRKDTIYKFIEKTTKFVFPEVIQKQQTSITEFDNNLQQLLQKGDEIRQILFDEVKYITQTISPKTKPLPQILQNIEEKAITAAREAERLEADKLFQEITQSMEMKAEDTAVKEVEEPEPILKFKKEEPDVFTDSILGIKQHCPYCGTIIPERLLNLLRKGYEPECPNCGEIIKPSYVQLD